MAGVRGEKGMVHRGPGRNLSGKESHMKERTVLRGSWTNKDSQIRQGSVDYR